MGLSRLADGNPLVGPVPGLRNYWAACGVMQALRRRRVGLALAQWMIDGEPDSDIFAMDVARFGAYALDRTRSFERKSSTPNGSDSLS